MEMVVCVGGWVGARRRECLCLCLLTVLLVLSLWFLPCMVVVVCRCGEELFVAEVFRGFVYQQFHHHDWVRTV